MRNDNGRSPRDGGATSLRKRGIGAPKADARGDFHALEWRLGAAGLAAGVAQDLVARYSAAQVADALDVLPMRRPADAVGWLVRVISEPWNVRAQATAVRDVRVRAQRVQAAAVEAARREAERDQRLADWAAAICDALTDRQLTDVVTRITEPIGWLGRRSAPLAVTQLLAWAIRAAGRTPERPLNAVVIDALGTTDLPADVPPPPHISTLTTVHDFRIRVRRAATALDRNDVDRQLSSKGSAMTCRRSAGGISHDV